MSVSFAGHELHSPRFALEEARELARERFGVEGAGQRARLAPGSERARSTRAAGRFVLKIANAAFGEAELDLQNRAMVHLARAPAARGAAALRARSTASEIVAVERDGVTYLLRLVDVHRGRAADRRSRISRRRCCARSARPPASSRARSRTSSTRPPTAPCSGTRATSAPSSRRSRRTSRIRAGARSPSGSRAAAAEAIERLAPRLPRQIVHCDVTDWNVIGRRDRAGRLMPCGVIDFGDVTRTLRVCELAVAASIAYGHDPDEPICAAAEIVRGFDAACPLDDAELEALPHLIAARAAIVAVGTEQQAVLEPHNAYAQRVRAGDWAICETAAARARRARRGGLPARLRARAPRGSRRACRPGVWPLPGVAPGATLAGATSRRRRLALDRAAALARGRDRRPRRGAPARRRASSRTPSPRRSTSGSTSSRAAGSEVRRAAGGPRRAQRARASSCSRPAGVAVRLAGLAPAVAAGDERRGRARRRQRRGGRGALPPHLHVQVAPAGLRTLPGLAHAGARRRVARALPAPGPAARARRPPSAPAARCSRAAAR